MKLLLKNPTIKKKKKKIKYKTISKKKHKYIKKICSNIPKKYYAGLDYDDVIIQCKQIRKERQKYKSAKKKKNKDRFKSLEGSRPNLKSYKPKKSQHVIDFENLYNINMGNLKLIENVTGIPVEASEKVLKKGRGAFSSSGSRPGQTAESWARARLASFALGRGAYKADYSIWKEYNIDKKIKVPKNQFSRLSNFKKS